jgi:hypothetical protein
MGVRVAAGAHDEFDREAGGADRGDPGFDFAELVGRVLGVGEVDDRELRRRRAEQFGFARFGVPERRAVLDQEAGEGGGVFEGGAVGKVAPRRRSVG